MKKITARDICFIAIFAALISVVSPFSIPLPGGIPMSLQTLIIPLAAIVLGAWRGFLAALIYVLLGAVGLPVFSGMSGGVGMIAGMTGGFIVSFPLLALISGFGEDLGVKLSAGKTGVTKGLVHYGVLLIGLLAGSVVNYLIGSLWFVWVAGSTFAAALAACVIPFIPTSILKIALDMIFGPALKRALAKAGVFVPTTSSM